MVPHVRSHQSGSPSTHSEIATIHRTRSIQRTTLAVVAASGLFASSLLGAVASYDGGAKVGGGAYDNAVEFEYGTYAVCDDAVTYQYATGKDGNAYYNTYDDGAWAGWTGWDAQPSPVAWDAAPVTYDGATYAFYTGTDSHLYEIAGDAGWKDISGDYTYASAPYATATDDGLYLYASGEDGYVYQRSYTTADGWDSWTAVSETAGKGKPYATSWGDHQNVFYTDNAGKSYWNRYSYADGTWSGEIEIPADYGFKSTPYAVGYEPEGKLYAYAVTEDGAPAYNVFDGDGWAGWQTWDVDWSADYQPNAYVYNGTQHVAYTSGDGHAYAITYGTDGWSEWEDLGGNYAYDTQQYECGNTLSLTYTGKDGAIYTKTYSGGEVAPEPSPTPKKKY